MPSNVPSAEELRGYRRPVLIVDDEPAVADLVAAILEGDGLEVVKARNGREALDWLDQAKGAFPSLVLLDIKMPVMDGREFARQFAARWRSIAPIMVMTAYDDAAAIADEIGATGWIGKPFDIRALSEAVRQRVASPPPR